MTKDQFIEKWYPILQNDRATNVADEFISDLNSLFNLRTEEEVRELIAGYDDIIESTKSPSKRSLHQSLKELCKWFLKDGS